jgi:hypothetical protein
MYIYELHLLSCPYLWLEMLPTKLHLCRNEIKVQPEIKFTSSYL